jgi:RNA polymerase sigma-70 factor, ECF subfamily
METGMESFEAEAMPHMNDLFRSAAAILGSRTEAEDITQELYLEAWKSFHRFTPGTNCRAWLYRILFHVIAHHRRKFFKFRFIDDPEILEETMVYEPPVPEHLSDEDMMLAFRRLPQQYSEVVMLADVHEFSYKEIQEVLGIPIGTVMSRLSRGRKLLRGYLTESGSRYEVRPPVAAFS